MVYIHKYADVSDYLSGESLVAVFGDLINCRSISSIQDGTNVYHEFVDPSQIANLKRQFGNGFLGIGIKFIREYKCYFETLHEPWFSAIREGKKIVEGRLDKSWVKDLRLLDMIEFTRVTPKNFIDLFDEVGLENILPSKETYEDGIAVYRQWYSETKEQEYGVVGIFIKVIKI